MSFTLLHSCWISDRSYPDRKGTHNTKRNLQTQTAMWTVWNRPGLEQTSGLIYKSDPRFTQTVEMRKMAEG